MELLSEIDGSWESFQTYAVGSELLVSSVCSVSTKTELIAVSFFLQPSPASLEFQGAILSSEIGNEAERTLKACGLCLLNVHIASGDRNYSRSSHQLEYGGRRYHAQCANLWLNCIDSLLPALSPPALI